MLVDRNRFSLSGDSESTNADIATNIRAQFNPADGCCSTTAKKMSAGSIYSAEAGLKIIGNVLYRVSGQKGWVKQPQAFTSLPGKLRSLLSVRIIRARFSPISSSSQLSLVNNRKEDFSYFFLFPKLGESGFPNFTLSPSF